ncbi:MAG: hypothetical protein MUF18_01170 [Fimbriiglobus sp.]|jgi:hypothetical protein|nr:hypothetical protein [Fimbriiglobus sp.]
MSFTRTLFAVAALAVVGSVASAQVVRSGIGVRPVTTAGPVSSAVTIPAMQWQNAVLQAQLWQMYQPPVVFNPWVPVSAWTPIAPVNPWVNGLGYNPWVNNIARNPWVPGVVSTPGFVGGSTGSFYRNYTNPWGR